MQKWNVKKREIEGIYFVKLMQITQTHGHNLFITTLQRYKLSAAV